MWYFYQEYKKEGHPSHVILSKEIKHKPNFDIEIAKQNLKSDK